MGAPGVSASPDSPRSGGPADAGGAAGAGDSPGLADYAEALADGVDSALVTWVVSCVTRLVTAWRGPIDPDLVLAAEAAGERCRAEVGAQMRLLLHADIDAQRGTPLAMLRAAVSYPTEILAGAGVPHVVRDPFAERVFPDDVYGLAPASFADVDPALAELGIAWGAAKAFEHKRRHRQPTPADETTSPEST